MEIITVSELHFQYNNEPILKDVSFQVNRGEFICVTGVNGSGKSTLLKLLIKLLKPTSGKAEIASSSVAYLAQRATAFNPDFPATAAEIVGLGIPRGEWISLKERKRRVQKALEQVGMSEYFNKSIGNLSGGQQQRILLAKALVREPDLILLDEPTVGIDKAASTQICCLLAELNKREGATLMMVTHDVPLILHHANRILQFERGGGIRLRTPNDFLHDITVH